MRELYRPRHYLKYLLSTVCLIALLLGASHRASAVIITIDLNDFYADSSVTVSADGSSALLEEDPFLSFVLLVNDPFFGDPNIILPGPGTRLLFDYAFDRAAGENDEFSVAVIDADTGLAFDGFEFFTIDSGAGTIGFDLSSLIGSTLGLQFALASLFGDTGFGSVATVSNVRLDIRDPVDVPVPGTLLLFATALAWLAAARRFPGSEEPGTA